MEQEQSAIPGDPSPMKNFVGGSGCGCGCLGALVILVGAIALGGIPMGFYDGETNLIVIAGGATLAAGVTAALAGTAMWVGSIFMD